MLILVVVLVGIIPTCIASLLAWQLGGVRTALTNTQESLAKALESLAQSRIEIDALKGHIEGMLTRFSDVYEQWEQDRARLVSANGELMKTNRNALDVIRACLSRGDVPPHLTAELRHEVLGDEK